MQTQIQETGPFERVLTVHVPEAEIQSAKKEAARKLSADMKVKGFRPGKVPPQVVEATVGAERLRSEAIETALPKVVSEAIIDTDLRPAVMPSVTNMRDAEGGVEVDVTVTLWPTVERLPILEGRRVAVEPPTVTEEELDQHVDRMREQFAELEDVSRPAMEGDFSLVDISATRNGQPLEDVSAKDLLYELGSQSFLDGLDENLVGKKTGDIVKFNSTLPEGFGEYGGEEVTLTALVKGVKRRKLPELTDEWAAEVSEHDTVEGLRDELREGVLAAKQTAVRRDLRSSAVDQVLEDLDLDLPQGLVDAEAQAQVHNFAHQLEAQGIDLATYFQVTGMTEDSFISDARAQADRALRTRVFLDALAEEEGLEVSDEEMEEMLEVLAQQAGKSKDEYRKALDEGGAEEVLKGDILRRKALDRLVASVIPVDADGEEVSLPDPQGENTEEGSDQEA